MDQWMNNRSDTALFSTNSEEETVIAQTKNRAHKQAHWRATIFISFAKTRSIPPGSEFRVAQGPAPPYSPHCL